MHNLNDCLQAVDAVLLAWISVLFLDLCLVAAGLQAQHLKFRHDAETLVSTGGNLYEPYDTDQPQQVQPQHSYSELNGGDVYSDFIADDNDLDLNGNIIMSHNHATDPAQDHITVGLDGEPYNAAKV